MRDSLPIVTLKGKRLITHGNVTVGNVAAMVANDDGSWKKLREGWQRLKWARKRWQSGHPERGTSAEAAAVALGIEPGTYRAYERAPGGKHIGLTDELAQKIGRKFKVTWVWLLSGQGSPFEAALPSQIDRIVRMLSDMPEDQQKAIGDMIEAFDRRTGTRG